MICLTVIFLLVVFYAIFAVNAYISIKYEVETIDNDNIIGMIYQIFDVGVIVNFIGLVINILKKSLKKDLIKVYRKACSNFSSFHLVS